MNFHYKPIKLKLGQTKSTKLHTTSSINENYLNENHRLSSSIQLVQLSHLLFFSCNYGVQSPDYCFPGLPVTHL